MCLPSEPLSTYPRAQAGAGSIRRTKEADQETLAKGLIVADPQEVMEVREKELRCDHVKNVQPDKSKKACGIEKRTEEKNLFFRGRGSRGDLFSHLLLP